MINAEKSDMPPNIDSAMAAIRPYRVRLFFKTVADGVEVPSLISLSFSFSCATFIKSGSIKLRFAFIRLFGSKRPDSEHRKSILSMNYRLFGNRYRPHTSVSECNKVVFKEIKQRLKLF